MWIDRKTYDDLRLTAAEHQGQVTALQASVATLTATMDWMRHRVNQLEHERAMLVQNVLGVTIQAPTIERTPAPRLPHDHPLNGTMSFEDVGEAEALRLGITHTDEGTLAYK
jgi:hypothetical protein